jgi:hypothetical protein
MNRHILLPLAGLAVFTGCSSVNSASSVRTHQMGERIEVGPLIYNVFEARWMPQLGQGAGARVPSHRFFLVRLNIVNSGSKPVTVPTLQLVDDRGATHTELSDGAEVPMWIGFLRESQPADTIQGNVVFDVPPAHYKLRITDENEVQTALVDIPLQFHSEGAEVTEAPTPPSMPQLKSPSAAPQKK